MGQLLLLRHGESEWNAAGRWQGWYDAPLTALGQEQAKAAGEQVRALVAGAVVHTVVASDLSRALQTAEIVASAIGVGTVSVDERLREVNVGDWTGLTQTEVDARYPEMFAGWRTGALERIPGGESRAELLARALEAMHELLRDAPADRVHVAVSHGGVVRALERHAGAHSDRVGNLCGRWFHLSGETLEAGDAFSAPV